MLRGYSARFGAFFQKTLREFLQRVRKLITLGFFLRPCTDLFDPLALVTTIKFTPVDPGGFQQAIQLINGITPLLLDLVNARENLFVPGSQRFVIRRRSLDDRRFPLQIAIDVSQQSLRSFPRFKNHQRNVAG